jgi:hypothetical protein
MDFSKEKFEKDKMLFERMIEMIENGEKDTIKNIIEEKFIETKNKI